MPNSYLLETGTDRYQPEDGAGVFLLESDYAQTILADSPVAYWRLGESAGALAKDSKGTNNGTYVNTPTLGVPGPLSAEPGTAITLLAASSQYVTAAELLLGNGPMSYELWLKRVSLSNASFLGLMDGGPLTPGLGFNDGGLDGKLDFYINGSGGAGGLNMARSSSALNDTNWHHVVATKATAAAPVIYVDGVDVTAITGGNGTTDDTTTRLFHIGIFPQGTGSTVTLPFDGSLDEVAVYNVVLTSTQVANHYAAGVVRIAYTNPMPPLLAQ